MNYACEQQRSQGLLNSLTIPPEAEVTETPIYAVGPDARRALAPDFRTGSPGQGHRLNDLSLS
jgi:hypothetical protein